MSIYLIFKRYLYTLLTMANEKFTINTNHMTKFYNMIETHFQKPKTTKEPRKPRTATNNTTENKEEECTQGLDVSDFGNDFALMIGLEGE
jgi:hypothetical protein